MYAKLVLRNVRRSVKDYLIYIVTLTICVTLFYSFLSVSSSYYKPDIGSAYDFTLTGDGMKMAVCGITLLILFLIRFVNKYMLVRRQKEFAIQSVMGMEQKTIGRLFFAETFVMGLLSIGSGIFLGMFCSQLIAAMFLTAYGKSYRISWMLFPDTVFLTICFFILSFLAVGLFNARSIRKMKIIDMLTAERENEPEPEKSRWMYVVAALYELFLLLMLIIGIRKVYFYYDSRFALPVRAMFWGNVLFPAVALAFSFLWLIRKRKRDFHILTLGLLICSVLNALPAVSVPSLMSKYYLPLGDGTVNQYLMFVLADLLFFICGVIYLAGSAILAWKEKSREHKYHNENLFFFGQIISKLNTTSKTMSIISITLTLAVFLFIAAPILVNWASGYLDSRSMYDVQIWSRYNHVYEEENLPGGGYGIVTGFLEGQGIETAYDCTFNLYLPVREDFHNRMKYDFPAAAISLSDYNAVRSMLGFEEITLKENEFTTHWKAVATGEEQDDFLKSHGTVKTDKGNLTLAQSPCHQEKMGGTMYNAYTDVLLVFPDNICRDLLPVIENRYIITKEPLSYDTARLLEAEFAEVYPEETETGAGYGIRLRTLQVNDIKGNNFVLQASMLYGAVVLMVICLTVLSLQQLLDAGHYRYRFSVLRKLGVEERNMERLMLKQLGVWFGLPVMLAIAVAAVATACFVRAISAEISAYIGFASLLQQVGITVGILILLLVCYFLSTWLLFRHSVDV